MYYYVFSKSPIAINHSKCFKSYINYTDEFLEVIFTHICNFILKFWVKVMNILYNFLFIPLSVNTYEVHPICFSPGTTKMSGL